MDFYGKVIVIKRNGSDGAQFPLTVDRCLFGRGHDCDIRVQLPSVDNEQCQIEIDSKGHVYMKNMGSSTPTLINEQKLSNSLTALSHGDVITIVDRKFRFEFPASSRFYPSKSPKAKSPRTSLGVSKSPQSLKQATPKKPLSPRTDNVPSSLNPKSPSSGKKTAGSPNVSREKKDGNARNSNVNNSNLTPSSRSEGASSDLLFSLSPASFYKASVTPNALKELSVGHRASRSQDSKLTGASSRMSLPRESPAAVGSPKSPSGKRTSGSLAKSKNLRKSITDLKRRSVPVFETEEGTPNSAGSEPDDGGNGKATPLFSRKRKSSNVVPLSSAKRKRVSFGPNLSPEHFDMSLPPTTPVRKGATPGGKETKRKSLLKSRIRNSISPAKKSPSPRKVPKSVSKASPKQLVGKLQTPSPSKMGTPKKMISSPRSRSASPQMITSEKKGISPRRKTPQIGTLISEEKEASPKSKTPQRVTPSKKKESSSEVKTPQVGTPMSEKKRVSPKAKTPQVGTPMSGKKGVSPKAKTPQIVTPISEKKGVSPKAKTPQIVTPMSGKKGVSPKAKTPQVVTPMSGKKGVSPKAKTPQVGTPLSEKKGVSPKAKTPQIVTPMSGKKRVSPKAKTPKVKTPQVGTPISEKYVSPKVTSALKMTPTSGKKMASAKRIPKSGKKGTSPKVNTPMTGRQKMGLKGRLEGSSSKSSLKSPKATTPKQKVMTQDDTNSPVDLFSQLTPLISESKSRDTSLKKKVNPSDMTSIGKMSGRKKDRIKELTPSGIKRLLKTPKEKRVKIAAVSPAGMKRLLKTPKVKRAGQAVSSPSGIKRIMKTPKGRENAMSLIGVKELLRSPKISRDLNDLDTGTLFVTPETEIQSNKKQSSADLASARTFRLIDTPRPVFSSKRSRTPKKFFGEDSTPKTTAAGSPRRSVGSLKASLTKRSDLSEQKSAKKVMVSSGSVGSAKRLPVQQFSKAPVSAKKLGKSPLNTPKSTKKFPKSPKSQRKNVPLLLPSVEKIVSPPQDFNKMVALRAIHARAVSPQLVKQGKAQTPKSFKKMPAGSAKKQTGPKTWSDIVKAGIPKSSTSGPFKPVGPVQKPSKKGLIITKKGARPLPKTPKFQVPSTSTGHIESPVTILVGKKALSKVKAKTPKPLPRKGRKVPPPQSKASRKSKGNTSFGGMAEMFSSPATPKLRDSLLYADLPDTPNGPNEMFVSPLTKSSRKSVNLLGVRELFIEKKNSTDTRLTGLKELFTETKPRLSFSPTGIKRIMTTPKRSATLSLVGVKRLQASTRKSAPVSPLGLLSPKEPTSGKRGRSTRKLVSAVEQGVDAAGAAAYKSKASVTSPAKAAKTSTPIPVKANATPSPAKRQARAKGKAPTPGKSPTPGQTRTKTARQNSVAVTVDSATAVKTPPQVKTRTRKAAATVVAKTQTPKKTKTKAAVNAATPAKSDRAATGKRKAADSLITSPLKAKGTTPIPVEANASPAPAKRRTRAVEKTPTPRQTRTKAVRKVATPVKSPSPVKAKTKKAAVTDVAKTQTAEKIRGKVAPNAATQAKSERAATGKRKASDSVITSPVKKAKVSTPIPVKANVSPAPAKRRTRAVGKATTPAKSSTPRKTKTKTVRIALTPVESYSMTGVTSPAPVKTRTRKTATTVVAKTPTPEKTRSKPAPNVAKPAKSHRAATKGVKDNTPIPAPAKRQTRAVGKAPTPAKSPTPSKARTKGGRKAPVPLVSDSMAAVKSPAPTKTRTKEAAVTAVAKTQTTKKTRTKTAFNATTPTKSGATTGKRKASDPVITSPVKKAKTSTPAPMKASATPAATKRRTRAVGKVPTPVKSPPKIRTKVGRKAPTPVAVVKSPTPVKTRTKKAAVKAVAKTKTPEKTKTKVTPKTKTKVAPKTKAKVAPKTKVATKAAKEIAGKKNVGSSKSPISTRTRRR